MIRLNPLVQSYELISTSEPSATASVSKLSKASSLSSKSAQGAGAEGEFDTRTHTYTVTDKLDNLNSWTAVLSPKQVTYTSALTSTVTGLDSVVNAPMGMVSSVTWNVVEGEGGALVLEEHGKVKCNRLVAGFVKGAMVESHGVLARGFAAKLTEEDTERSDENAN
jgi:hypothetical protein